jgi:hypothetical protein
MSVERKGEHVENFFAMDRATMKSAAQPKVIESAGCGSDRGRVELALESLCSQGCKAVWGTIESLESGAALPQTDGMSEAELDLLLAELKSIMAVYAGTCGA